MPKSMYIALVTVNGVVKSVEGKSQSGLGSALGGFSDERIGMGITDALNKCDAEGYEFFHIDTIGDKNIYRLKLKAKQR